MPEMRGFLLKTAFTAIPLQPEMKWKWNFLDKKKEEKFKKIIIIFYNTSKFWNLHI